MSKKIEDWYEDINKNTKNLEVKDYFEFFFHRDPNRVYTIDDNYFYAPADGIIIYAKSVLPDEQIVEVKGRNFTIRDLLFDKDYNSVSIVIGIYMTSYDVHINRIPYGGFLKSKNAPCLKTNNKLMTNFNLKDGHFAFDNNKSDYLFDNQRVINTIICPKINYRYYVVQIADNEVDSICHFSQISKFYHQNKRFSLIRYGSQVDLILPLSKHLDFKFIEREKSHLHHIEAGIDRLIKIDKK